MNTTSTLPAVGLHWLLGLLLAAQGDLDGALVELRRELDAEIPGHVYTRECIANTWYAIGAILLRLKRMDEARDAFQHSLARVPSHALARLGLAAASGASLEQIGPSPEPSAISPEPSALSPEEALVRAVALALRGQHDEAARLCADALSAAPPGSALWILPVEPLINASAHADIWAPTLAILRDRAS